MTDIRERVARAMQKADAGPICCLPDNEFFNAISAVALKECGYAEMRKALEDLHKASARVSRLGATVGPQWSYLTAAVLSARSILERTGEK